MTEPQEPEPIVVQPAVVDTRGCLLCPGCGFSNVHYNLEQLTIAPDSDDYESPAGTRGEFMLIPMWCEQCNTGFALTIANHKGDMYLRFVPYAHSGDREAWGEVR